MRTFIYAIELTTARVRNCTDVLCEETEAGVKYDTIILDGEEKSAMSGSEEGFEMKAKPIGFASALLM
ncbi:hypothetical protein NDU88_005600 [Pleurodeles waltl]|uniref:Uncharacterized protein n=1 Tax=Pleurodeles waltl TaxID=8319 RepID=A0AAV7PFW3_PLEWA|nr:hypothetical protein NDU88_005600 [Pleurodeles waltl]